METEFVKCEVQDHVALVTMDRPPVNAVNAQVHEEIMRVFDTLSDRDDVRVAILTGDARAVGKADGATGLCGHVVDGRRLRRLHEKNSGAGLLTVLIARPTIGPRLPTRSALGAATPRWYNRRTGGAPCRVHG